VMPLRVAAQSGSRYSLGSKGGGSNLRGSGSGMRSLATLAASLVVVGCASTPANPPEWYRQRERTIESSYPDLHSVPRTVNLTLDPAHWAEVQADLDAAKAEVRSDPRSVWTQPDDPNVFLNDARAELERTRLAHEGH